ncbi:MAG: hypothetical protein QM790_03425 [Nibricoccus sp.]
MRPRLFGYPLLTSFLFLSVAGSVGLATLLLAGSALHGELIGGVLGIFAAPLIAMVGSIVLLIVAAIPFTVFARWVFWKAKWSEQLRWLVIPLTGPIVFCVLGPISLLLGDSDIFGAAPFSFVLGVVISTYWLSYLLFDLRFKKQRANQALQHNA